MKDQTMIGAGVKLVTTQEYCVLNPGRVHHPVNFCKGSTVVTTGKIGVCILPDGSLVPGIEVTFSNLHPPNFTIPLSVLKLAGE